MLQNKFKVLISNGRIVFDPNDAQRYKTALAFLENNYEGKAEVIIDRARVPITDRQRKRYWAILKIAGETAGYTQQELHDLLKDKFLREYIPKEKGKFEVKIRSITDLTTTEMVVYEEQAIAFLVDFFGLVDFDPDNIVY